MEPETNMMLAFLESMNATRWGLLGITLVGIELITGSTYILWPAVAAIVIAIWVFFLPLSWEMQFLAFFAISLALLVIGHYYVRPLMKSGEPSDLNDPGRTMLGRRVVAFTDFENGHGRVTVGDTQWKAASEGADPKSGDRLIITAVTGATLIVEAAVEA
ncbi:NfeD family protein [Litorimonas sp. WD9-15]|uniref:NfeD family protein n=1 Tax=Litorimonas sp. WD9-15 TaxID=3418716 RepID=UPI003D04E600